MAVAADGAWEGGGAEDDVAAGVESDLVDASHADEGVDVIGVELGDGQTWNDAEQLLIGGCPGSARRVLAWTARAERGCGQ